MVATNFERLVGYRTLDEGQVPVKAYCMAVFMAEFSGLPFVLQHSCSMAWTCQPYIATESTDSVIDSLVLTSR